MLIVRNVLSRVYRVGVMGSRFEGYDNGMAITSRSDHNNVHAAASRM